MILRTMVPESVEGKQRLYDRYPIGGSVTLKVTMSGTDRDIVHAWAKAEQKHPAKFVRDLLTEAGGHTICDVVRVEGEPGADGFRQGMILRVLVEVVDG